MESTISYLETLVRETHRPETEVMTLAFQTGIRTLWREHILSRYLHQTLSRQEAIEQVGIDWVELAERQQEAMQEDLTWALEN